MLQLCARIVPGSLVVVAAAAQLFAVGAGAAPINYGDFSDIPPGGVLYLDVTETANSPGESEPLYGAPSISADQLDFDPAGFHAVADDNGAAFTDGQLNFELSGANRWIESIQLSAAGDYTLLGGGSALSVSAMSIHVSALEVDDVSLPEPVRLLASSSSVQQSLATTGNAGLEPWTLDLTYDVDAALSAAGISFVDGATRLEIVIDLALGAISDGDSLAAISAKDFSIFAEVGMTGASAIPEPQSGVLLGLGFLAFGVARRGRTR